MEKNTIEEVVSDLKAKRDALSLAHENLKHENDKYNKIIISLSLFGGFLESAKLQMGWESDIAKLAPIAISSILAIISSLIKFKKYPEQMESVIGARDMLTNILNKSRGHTNITEDLQKEYHNALEKLEVSVYPDVRKKYLKQSHKNLIEIMKLEQKYYNNIELVNSGEVILDTDSSIEDNPFIGETNTAESL